MVTDFREEAGQSCFAQLGLFKSDLQNMVAVRNFQIAQLKVTTIDTDGQGSNPVSGEVLAAAGFRNGRQSQAAAIQSVTE